MQLGLRLSESGECANDRHGVVDCQRYFRLVIDMRRYRN